ncbi:hypothetical protein G6F50_015835 [Rhizopus delemar]|uniref:Uncharacterized protein n=1 Tax=Rhizopus delemar TaxID=936053 RepID=A0A9P7C2J2_9FUNG|nr:hypothetical protein G6F50_015835 [Rhizopus delemar]
MPPLAWRRSCARNRLRQGLWQRPARRPAPAAARAHRGRAGGAADEPGHVGQPRQRTAAGGDRRSRSPVAAAGHSRKPGRAIEGRHAGERARRRWQTPAGHAAACG